MEKLTADQRRQAEQAKPAMQAQAEASQDARTFAIKQFVVLQTVEVCKVLDCGVRDLEFVMTTMYRFLTEKTPL